MDLITVADVRFARSRDECVLQPGERWLGGGTWLYSEPQDGLTGLVDLTRMGWRPLEWQHGDLVIAATCTFAELSRLEGDFAAHPLIWQCVTALLGSFKVWNVATVAGNVCMALPAGPMTALLAAWDATALVWRPDGTDRVIPVVDLVTGVQSTALEPGELVRSFCVPAASLASRTGFRRIALSPLGRTGTLVIARASDAELTWTVTGGVTRPRQVRFESMPDAAALAAAIDTIDDWYDDAHGTPDWRRAMSLRFAEELREELS